LLNPMIVEGDCFKYMVVRSKVVELRVVESKVVESKVVESKVVESKDPYFTVVELPPVKCCIVECQYFPPPLCLSPVGQELVQSQ
jgi:hypothetical protein